MQRARKWKMYRFQTEKNWLDKSWALTVLSFQNTLLSFNCHNQLLIVICHFGTSIILLTDLQKSHGKAKKSTRRLTRKQLSPGAPYHQTPGTGGLTLHRHVIAPLRTTASRIFSYSIRPQDTSSFLVTKTASYQKLSRAINVQMNNVQILRPTWVPIIQNDDGKVDLVKSTLTYATDLWSYNILCQWWGMLWV